MPPSWNPIDDLRRLGLPPGASADALKPAWRRAVSALHPDRNGTGADRELAEVNAAFQRLQAFAQRHGRLPTSPHPPSAPHPTPRQALSRWAVSALAVVAAVVVLWPQSQPAEPSPPPAPDAPTEAAAPPNPSPGSASVGASTRLLRVGLEAAEVEHLVGPPLFRSAERWEYGPSEVRFTDGRVSGWYSSALRPLPVGDTPTFPPHGN